MPLQVPIRFVAGALDIGIKQTPQEFYEEMMAKASAFWDGAIGFQNGGPQPTSNVGPWLKNGNEWRFFNSITGTYDLTVYTAGDIMPTAAVVIDEATGWLKTDGRQFSTTDYPALFGAIAYTYNLSSDNSSGSPIDPTKFRIPNLQGRTPMGSGTGAGLTARILGSFVGSESVTLVANQLPETFGLKAPTMSGNANNQNTGWWRTNPSSDGKVGDDTVTVTNVGGGQPTATVSPSLVISFKIHI